MELKDICAPLGGDLELVDLELKSSIEALAAKSSRDMLEHFFRKKGKYLRPLLVLLSSKAAAGAKPYDSREAVNMAVACELIHSASLIHDDIVDGSKIRRSQFTLNILFGNKMAVLAGDLLYSQAFSLLSGIGRADITAVVCSAAKNMCHGEINEMQSRTLPGLKEYLEVIKGKTAVFMASCCRCGAMLAVKEGQKIDALEAYGMNIGMAYQLIDDYLDGDCGINGINKIREAEVFAEKAKEELRFFPPSVYKESLFSLVDYILDCARVGNAG